MTKKELMQRLRRERRAAGLVSVTIWTTPDKVELFKKMAGSKLQCREPKKEDDPWIV